MSLAIFGFVRILMFLQDWFFKNHFLNLATNTPPAAAQQPSLPASHRHTTVKYVRCTVDTYDTWTWQQSLERRWKKQQSGNHWVPP